MKHTVKIAVSTLHFTQTLVLVATSVTLGLTQGEVFRTEKLEDTQEV
jgi:hypothetical protein